MKKAILVTLWCVFFILVCMVSLGEAQGATDNITLRPFNGYTEFAEWVSSYEVPELDDDCDDYAYLMFIDGLNKGYWVSCQLELTGEEMWEDGDAHMYVTGYIKYGDGSIRPRFVDGETRKIFKKMYGYMWRLD